MQSYENRNKLARSVGKLVPIEMLAVC
jgi:hypothetical protein